MTREGNGNGDSLHLSFGYEKFKIIQNKHMRYLIFIFHPPLFVLLPCLKKQNAILLRFLKLYILEMELKRNQFHSKIISDRFWEILILFTEKIKIK